MPTCHSTARATSESGNIVLAGNPNVGKSVIFGALTGKYADVSNYPGTTIEILEGNHEGRQVLDTPGVYGISSFNDEERITRDIVLGAGMVVNVVNAARLRQDLFLTLQLADAGLPMVIALNMIDEARAAGISVDAEALSHELGVPVVPCSAILGEGMAELSRALSTAHRAKADPEIANQLQSKYPRIRPGDALLILEGDESIAARYGLEPGKEREAVYRHRRDRADQIASLVTHELSSGIRAGVRLGRLTLRPLTGLPFMLLVMAVVFYLLGVVVAGHVVGFTEGTIMDGLFSPLVRRLVSFVLPPTSVAGRLIAGRYGVLTMGLSYLFGLLLPLVLAFYLLLSVLEDSGYLPRMAVLTDRFLTAIGLNGRAIIPIILGFGCVTMATITTRLLGSRRERFIATLLLGLAIPCSAQLGVIAGMAARLGPKYSVVYLSVLLLVFGGTGWLLNRVLPGESSDLLIELPPLRIPRPGNVLVKTLHKSRHFIVETVPIFLLGSLLLGVIDETGILMRVQALARPVVSGWLGLPEDTATALLMGLLRRDFGAAGLTAVPMTPSQSMTALITMTLFVPCVASMMVIIRERGWKDGLLVWAGSFGTALLAGGIFHRLLG